MAFRKEAFEKYGGFRTDLGPNPKNEIRGEDTEFGRRLMLAGEHLYYEPDAVVFHNVVESRIRKEYFLAWYFDFGRGMAREAESAPSLLGIQPAYIDILKIGSTSLPALTLRWMLSFRPCKKFFYKALVWRTAGHIAETYKLASPKKN